SLLACRNVLIRSSGASAFGIHLSRLPRFAGWCRPSGAGLMTQPAAPAFLACWLAPFETLFTRPTWQNLLVLLAGAILAPGRRTVPAALRILGLREGTSFTNFHRVLNRNRWPTRAVAKRLLHLRLDTF